MKPVDKRDGGGSHNWGTYEDDMKAEEDKANVSADGGDGSGSGALNTSSGEEKKEGEGDLARFEHVL